LILGNAKHAGNVFESVKIKSLVKWNSYGISMP